jgi:hypothetical protein
MANISDTTNKEMSFAGKKSIKVCGFSAYFPKIAKYPTTPTKL